MIRENKKNVVDVISFCTGSNIMVLRDQQGTKYEMVIRKINGKLVTWIPNWYPLSLLKDYKVDGKTISEIGRELEEYDISIPFYTYVDKILDY